MASPGDVRFSTESGQWEELTRGSFNRTSWKPLPDQDLGNGQYRLNPQSGQWEQLLQVEDKAEQFAFRWTPLVAFDPELARDLEGIVGVSYETGKPIFFEEDGTGFSLPTGEEPGRIAPAEEFGGPPGSLVIANPSGAITPYRPDQPDSALSLDQQIAQAVANDDMPEARRLSGAKAELSAISSPKEKVEQLPRSVDEYLTRLYVEGKWDIADQVLSFMERPTASERLDMALQLAKSPADQFVLSAMLRGELPMQQSMTTDGRVAPLPAELQKAAEDFFGVTPGERFGQTEQGERRFGVHGEFLGETQPQSEEEATSQAMQMAREATSTRTGPPTGFGSEEFPEPMSPGQSLMDEMGGEFGPSVNPPLTAFGQPLTQGAPAAAGSVRTPGGLSAPIDMVRQQQMEAEREKRFYGAGEGTTARMGVSLEPGSTELVNPDTGDVQYVFDSNSMNHYLGQGYKVRRQSTAPARFASPTAPADSQRFGTSLTQSERDLAFKGTALGQARQLSDLPGAPRFRSSQAIARQTPTERARFGALVATTGIRPEDWEEQERRRFVGGGQRSTAVGTRFGR